MNRPWMPLYVADYLADTGHLSTLEHGAYMLLIMHYWQNGRLPTDDPQLARICRLSKASWAGIRETMEALFDEGWHHKRIDAELAKACEADAKRSAAGKAGASARYANRNSNRIANAGQSDGYARARHFHNTKQEGDSSSTSETSGITPIGKNGKEPYAFECGVVRLNQRDLDRWIEAFPHVAVKAELTGAEPWLARQASWFNAGASMLAKKEREATAPREPELPPEDPRLVGF